MPLSSVSECNTTVIQIIGKISNDSLKQGPLSFIIENLVCPLLLHYLLDLHIDLAIVTAVGVLLKRMCPVKIAQLACNYEYCCKPDKHSYFI